MNIEDIPEMDRALIARLLLDMREAGNARPLIPLEVDLNGDGVHDAFGLGPDGALVMVSGVALKETGYVSEGDDWTEDS